MSSLGSLPQPIERGELSGLPVFHLPSPGPTLGMLIFRVGSADEQLPYAGITHLAEHLALFQIASRPTAFTYNAAVEYVSTTFWARGTPVEVGDHLNRLTVALHDLPVDRLPDEVRVLRAERDDSPSLLDQMLTSRFGAMTYGLRAYQELGLTAVDGNAVREWARRRFVRPSAALAFLGEVPAGLTLELPDGDRPTSIPSTGRSVRLPAWTGIRDVLAVTAVGSRSTEALVALGCAQRSLSDRLRRDQGVAYAVKASFDLFDGSLAHAALSTATAAKDSSAAMTGFVETLLRLVEEGPDPDVLAAVKEARRRVLADPDQAATRLSQRTLDYLRGLSPPSGEAELHEIEASSVDRIAEVASDWFRTAIVFTPDSTAPACDARKLYALPTWSQRRLQGRRFVRVRPLREGVHQVYVGSEGVMAVMDAERVLTIPFDECVVLIVPSPDARVLYALDGMVLSLRAKDWRNWPDLAQMIDRGVPAGRHIVMPDGDRPRPTGKSRWHLAGWSLPPTWRPVLVYVQILAACTLVFYLFRGLAFALPDVRTQWLPVVVLTVLLVVIPTLVFRR